MLGNAVPSLLAEVLAREIRRQLLGDQRAPGPLQLMPSVREPLPDPDPIADLPDKYRALIGSHPDHPGERKKKPRREGPGPIWAERLPLPVEEGVGD